MEKRQFDVTALGELLIDFTENGFSSQGNPLMEANPGGAPCNVLAMLERLGKRTAFIGKVGKDMFGNQLKSAVEEVGIDTRNLILDEKYHTTLAFVHTYPDGDRDFSFYRDPGADMMLTKDEVQKELIESSRIFHFGTLSSTHEGVREATRHAIELAKEAGCIITFDPNLRPPLWKSLDDARAEIEYGMSKCDVLKISDNEVEFMCGTTDYDKGAAMIQEKYNIPLILITLGKDGSRAYYKNMRVEAAPFLQENTIETTGAGDTFCASTLNYVLDHGLENLTEENLKELLTFANAAASLITYGIMLGEKPAVLSAIVKYHCTHRAQQSIIDAMDIAGGKGIMLGEGNFLARGYQGAPIAITVEGANILTRSMMIFGQGAIRCHPYVLEEMAAAQNNDVDAFDKLLFKHIGHVGSNKVRSFWLGLTRGLTSATPTGDATKRYYQHLNRLSANLALLSDVSMAVLGGSLKRRERISARLGDVLSQIFLASAVLKRYDDEGRQEADLPLVHWGVQDALYQAEQAIDDLLANFPNRFVAGALRVVIFPTGRHHLAPSDKLDHKVAKILQVPSATRSRIGRGQYLTPTPHNPVGLLEEALLDVMAADPIHQKICKQLGKNLPFTRLDELAKQALAGGIINKDEAALLVKAEESRLRSINVDDFEPDELATQPVKLPEKHRKPEAA